MKTSKLKPITEAEFTRQVIQYAKLCGWRVAHFRPARTKDGWRTAVSGDGKGFPDLVMVRGADIVAAELKVGKNKLTVEQSAWLFSFSDAGAITRVWWPEHWKDIEDVLQ